jgi:hypothetical protein
MVKQRGRRAERFGLCRPDDGSPADAAPNKAQAATREGPAHLIVGILTEH